MGPLSSVGGVGINYAVQDAVVAADVLRGPLQSGRMSLRDLPARLIAFGIRRP